MTTVRLRNGASIEAHHVTLEAGRVRAQVPTFTYDIDGIGSLGVATRRQVGWASRSWPSRDVVELIEAPDRNRLAVAA